MTTILGRSIDYTDKDFDSLRARLLAMLRQQYPDWTDDAVGNFGTLLLEAWCFVGDVVTFYMDNAAAEAFIGTATQRSSLVKLAKLLGYEPAGRAAAQADVVFTLAAPPTGNVTIPEGTIVRTTGAGQVLEFRLLADVEIAAAANPPTGTGTCEHSVLHTNTLSASGLANQRVVLGSIPFVEVVSLTASNGIYAQVSDFLQSRVDDKHFTVAVDGQDKATVMFGNGTNGELPTGTITIIYTSGGGSIGNVAAGTLVKVAGSFTDDLANPVSVSCSNPAAASGGTNHETTESIRANAPASIRVLTRAVAREDYEIAAVEKMDGQVARALMLTSDQDPAVPENTGYLFVIPAGGGLPSTALKDDVEAIFDTPYEQGGLPKTVTFNLVALDPVYVEINIFAVVYLVAGASASVVADSIRSELETFFALTLANGAPNTEIDFGFASDGELPLSTITNIVRDVVGVRKLGEKLTDFLVNDVHADVELGLREFPVLGTVTLINGETGDPLG